MLAGVTHWVRASYIKINCRGIYLLCFPMKNVQTEIIENMNFRVITRISAIRLMMLTTFSVVFYYFYFPPRKIWPILVYCELTKVTVTI